VALGRREVYAEEALPQAARRGMGVIENNVSTDNTLDRRYTKIETWVIAHRLVSHHTNRVRASG
jgi:hypothetical protein